MHIMVVPSWYSSKENPVHGSFFKEQFKALAKSGEKVTVCYNEIWSITRLGKVKEKSGIINEVEDGLVTYRYKGFNFIPKFPLMFKFFNKRMEKLYLKTVEEQGKVDVIHAHSSFWGGISAAYVSGKYNIPLIITEHSSMKYAVYCKDSYKPYVKQSYNRADKIIVVSNGLKKEMEEYTETPIEVIHNLIDGEMFPISKGEGFNEYTFLTCGYLVEGKGFETLIKAFSNVFGGTKVKLRIASDGCLRGKLESMIKELNMEGNITLLGMLSRSELSLEMRKCDSFVLPSEHETFGMVYIEALCSGKPVIGAFNGGAEDIINDDNGIMVPIKDITSLEKALKKMYDTSNLYDGEKLREDCIDKFNEEKIINKIKKVYEEVRG